MSTVEAHPARVLTHDQGLSAAERCDRCGAQAWLKATMESGILMLCWHHGTAHFDALVMNAKRIDDYRPVLETAESRKALPAIS